LQAYDTVLMICTLLSDVTQHRLVVTNVLGQPIIPTFKDQASPLKMGQTGYPEISVTNYQPTLLNIPQEMSYYNPPLKNY
jgi:hypothetical protein